MKHLKTLNIRNQPDQEPASTPSYENSTHENLATTVAKTIYVADPKEMVIYPGDSYTGVTNLQRHLDGKVIR